MDCFLCLKKSEILVNIYDGLEEGFILLNIPNIIEKHVCFKPDKANPMLCENCWLVIESFYIFCLNIEKAHKDVVKIENYFDVKDEFNLEGENSVATDRLNSSCDEYESAYPLNNTEKSSFGAKYEDNKITENTENNARYKLRRQCRNKLDKSETNKVENEKEIYIKKANEDRTEELLFNDVEAHDPYNKTTKKSSEEVDEKISKFLTLSCDICGEQSPTFAALIKHFRLIHQKNGYAVCCNRKFRKRYLLINHINYHLNPDLFKCKLCDKTFSVADSLRKHNKDVHESKETYVQCDQCPKKFVQKVNLIRHKAYHLPVESWKFSCDECGKILPSQFYLTSHKASSHTISHKICYVCGKSVSTKRYKRHLMSHDVTSEEDKVECGICKAKLSKRYIKIHRRHHQEAEKGEFFCPICNHKSTNNKALNIHIRYTHAEQKNHECHICQKKFKRKLALRQHMGIHTGTNLYSCPYCPRTFTYDSNFYMHKKKEHPKEIEIEKQKLTRTNFAEHKKKPQFTKETENLAIINESSNTVKNIEIGALDEFSYIA